MKKRVEDNEEVREHRAIQKFMGHLAELRARIEPMCDDEKQLVEWGAFIKCHQIAIDANGVLFDDGRDMHVVEDYPLSLEIAHWITRLEMEGVCADFSDDYKPKALDILHEQLMPLIEKFYPLKSDDESTPYFPYNQYRGAAIWKDQKQSSKSDIHNA